MTNVAGIDEAVNVAANDLAEHVSALGTDLLLREAIAKMVIRDLIWAVYERFPSVRYELDEYLEIITDCVRESVKKELSV